MFEKKECKKVMPHFAIHARKVMIFLAFKMGNFKKRSL